MSTTITDGIASVTPTLIVEYAHARASQTRLHEVIGRATPDVALRAASSRAGTLRAVLASRAAADSLDALLASAAVFTIASSDEPRLDGLRFVVADGDVRVALEGTSTWVVEWPYREVAS